MIMHFHVLIVIHKNSLVKNKFHFYTIHFVCICSDFNFGDWHINNETDKRERQVTYKTISQSVLGTNNVTCTEKQVCFFCNYSIQ